MIKLGIAFVILLLLYLFYKEWRKSAKHEKKLAGYKERIEEADDTLDDLYIDNIMQTYDEEISDTKNSLKDRVTKFNTEDIKKDDK